MNEFNFYESVAHAVLYTARLMNNKFNCHVDDLGFDLTIEQVALLYFVAQNKDEQTIQQDLAEVLDKNKSAVLRTTDLLEKKGLLRRMPVPNDRRKNRLEITAEGEVVVNKILTMAQEKEKKLKVLIGEKDLAAFHRVLRVLQNTV